MLEQVICAPFLQEFRKFHAFLCIVFYAEQRGNIELLYKSSISHNIFGQISKS